MSRPFPFPEDASSPPRPFELSLDAGFLDMTLRKVRDYRPTQSLSDEWTMEGPPTATMTRLAAYWADEYDWRSVEKSINERFAHYAVTVQPPESSSYKAPIPLHFIHEKCKSSPSSSSSSSGTIPLLLLHGWPSTSLEWSKVIGPLAEKFHVVAPDLPGFGFSPAPARPGMGPLEMGRAFHALMTEHLGYERYGVVSTDLGWLVGMWMAAEYGPAGAIVGHMSDFFLGQPTPEDAARLEAGEASEEEKRHVAATKAWFDSHWAYATTHGQKPLALSLALGDSPVGFLGWYMDVNHATSDGHVYADEELVTDAMMLWIPGPYAGIRTYREFFQVNSLSLPLPLFLPSFLFLSVSLPILCFCLVFSLYDSRWNEELTEWMTAGQDELSPEPGPHGSFGMGMEQRPLCLRLRFRLCRKSPPPFSLFPIANRRSGLWDEESMERSTRLTPMAARGMGPAHRQPQVFQEARVRRPFPRGQLPGGVDAGRVQLLREPELGGGFISFVLGRKQVVMTLRKKDIYWRVATGPGTNSRFRHWCRDVVFEHT